MSEGNFGRGTLTAVGAPVGEDEGELIDAGGLIVVGCAGALGFGVADGIAIFGAGAVVIVGGLLGGAAGSPGATPQRPPFAQILLRFGGRTCAFRSAVCARAAIMTMDSTSVFIEAARHHDLEVD